MKTFLLFFLFPIITFGQIGTQTASIKKPVHNPTTISTDNYGIGPISAISPNRDTLCLANNQIGNCILQLWVSDTTYKSISLNHWKTNKGQKPSVIILVSDVANVSKSYKLNK